MVYKNVLKNELYNSLINPLMPKSTNINSIAKISFLKRRDHAWKQFLMNVRLRVGKR